MQYPHKIAIVVREDLQDWQKLNVASFLASSVAIKFPEVHGKAFVSASGSEYLPFIKQPILIYQAKSDEQIQRAFRRSKERDLEIGLYTENLFSTHCEEDNISEIAKYKDDEQILAGIVVYGENKVVSKALDGLTLHP